MKLQISGFFGIVLALLILAATLAMAAGGAIVHGYLLGIGIHASSSACPCGTDCKCESCCCRGAK